MSQVIRISDSVYGRLEAHASGFDTPSNVIEKLLDAYEGVVTYQPSSSDSATDTNAQTADNLDIVYLSNNEEVSEETFKQQLLAKRKAYIKIHRTNSTTEVGEWNAARLKDSSNVNQNLRSGKLRGWKKRGIYRAEVSVNKYDFAELAS